MVARVGDWDGSVLAGWSRLFRVRLGSCAGRVSCEGLTGQLLARQLIGSLDRIAIRADDLHAEEMAGGVLLEAEHHGLEHLEGLLLVGDERILLGVAAQADAFLEVVHGEEMVLPEAIEDAEHDDALVITHGRGAEDLLLDVVASAKFVEDGFAQLVAVELGGVDLVFEMGTEDVVEIAEERRELPLFGVLLFRGVLVEEVGEDGGDVVVGDELLLVYAFHELAAEAVDGFALLVHDVVVLEDVFAGLEVLGFDGLLGGLDAAGDHAGFDGDALFHAEALEESGDPLAGEDAHEVVFEREVEARGSGVALTAGASAKLVVDAARLVTLGAEDVQASGADDCVVLSLGCSFVRGYCGIPGGLRGFELLRLIVEAEHARRRDGRDGSFRYRDGAGLLLADEVLAGHEVGVAAEEDVGAAACHVGGDGDHADAAGLGDDLGFLLVELGVEDDVADALALEDLGEELGFFDAGGADEDGLLLASWRRAISSATAKYFSFAVR